MLQTLVNPYNNPETTSSPLVIKRAVRRYYFAAVLFGLVGVCIAAPCCDVLNQELQIIPTSTFIHGFEAHGTPIPRSNLLWFSLGIGGTLLTSSAYPAVFSYANARRNRILLQRSPQAG